MLVRFRPPHPLHVKVAYAREGQEDPPLPEPMMVGIVDLDSVLNEGNVVSIAVFPPKMQCFPCSFARVYF